MTCSRCGTKKKKTEFNEISRGRLRRHCKACEKVLPQGNKEERRRANKRRLKETHPAYIVDIHETFEQKLARFSEMAAARERARSTYRAKEQKIYHQKKAGRKYRRLVRMGLINPE